MSLLYENSLQAFVIITLLLGGGAAWMTGRAISVTWGPLWQALAYMIPLTGAARFLHFALADGVLLSAWYFVVNFAILCAIAAISFQFARTALMAQQYPWLYKRSSPFSVTKI
ncbi:MAG: DUF6867 family protein [Pseudomonadota bacterium]